MKYIHPLIINTVIHNFNGVAMNIKTYKQIFVFIVLQKTITNRVQKCPFNIGFGKTVLEGGLIIDNTRIHE
jgi:hypothetical protein